ncbi:DUF2218 domain-containing protein [Ornithinimicrobium panacihumi]|uniref:DUF2218 domain-containing protein n=1 Tax=Ornithinimicrobium panacihumi TaxID=2008449 RepID=UPI003F8C83A7
MIRIDNVTHRYGTTTVLDDVTLELPRGQLTSIIGANGAGKSTLLSVVARLLRPTAGQVHVDDLEVLSARDDEVARRLAVLRQDNHVAARLTVRDLVCFGRFPHSKGRLTPECHAKVDESLRWMELEDLADRYLDQLSGGQRQRAFIAMVLAQDTDYLLLDEPLNNLDMKHSASMMSMVRRAVDELGKTAVIVLHDINFASAYSDHVVAMRDGAVVAAGPPEQIMHRGVLQTVFDMDIHVQDLHGMRLGIFWTPGAPVPQVEPLAATGDHSPTDLHLPSEEILMAHLTTTADVATTAPGRYAKQLASHLGRKMTVTETAVGPELTMSNEVGTATCLLDSSRADILRLEVRGEDQEVVDRMAHVVGSHLERFGERAGLAVRWESA